MTDIKVLTKAAESFELGIPVLVIGAGACGLTAALAAKDAGVDVMVLERDSFPRGSTAMSSGMVPASGTRFQKAAGIEDSPAIQASDILNKNHHEANPDIVHELSENSARVIEWLTDQHNIPFELVTGFLYPGHTRMRMHATPNKTGDELMGALMNAAETAGIDVVTDAHVTTLFVDETKKIVGISLLRPDGSEEEIGCDALILACCGFGSNAELVKKYIPEMADATYFGHEHNYGEAILWGEQIGAKLTDLTAYQGHASLSFPQQVLITWAVIMEGGFQININGKRFANEASGYSEQSREVLSQPERIAWNIFDERIHQLGRQFQDYRDAEYAGAVIQANSIAELAEKIGVPAIDLIETYTTIENCADAAAPDKFGRHFSQEKLLRAPFYAIRVTGALFHTQGGLEVNRKGQVLDSEGKPLPNLFAGGGAARGVSGAGGSGYMSGNGLLSAIVLGAICGESASKQC